jgi:hypothetical protein
MYLNLISISSNDDAQCVYISFLYQAIMINVSISISSSDDDGCVCISNPYQAMMMTMINVSICHVSSFLIYYVNFLALNPKIFIIFGSLSSSRKIGSFFNLPLNIERDDHLKGDVRDIFISSCLCLIFLFCYHNHHQQVFVM